MSATLCLWMKTKSPGLQLKYKQKMECGERISIQLLFENNRLRTTLHGKTWFENKFYFTKILYNPDFIHFTSEMFRYQCNTNGARMRARQFKLLVKGFDTLLKIYLLRIYLFIYFLIYSLNLCIYLFIYLFICVSFLGRGESRQLTTNGTMSA